MSNVAGLDLNGDPLQKNLDLTTKHKKCCVVRTVRLLKTKLRWCKFSKDPESEQKVRSVWLKMMAKFAMDPSRPQTNVKVLV